MNERIAISMYIASKQETGKSERKQISIMRRKRNRKRGERKMKAGGKEDME